MFKCGKSFPYHFCLNVVARLVLYLSRPKPRYGGGGMKSTWGKVDKNEIGLQIE